MASILQQGSGDAKRAHAIAISDFNIQPSEGSYRLLTGAALSAEQEEDIRLSAVVHANLDEHKRRLAEAARCGAGGAEDEADVKEDDDGEQPAGEEYAQPEGDEDRVLKNTRPARESDGLLSVQELGDLYQSSVHGSIESAYGSKYGRLQDETGNWYGERAGKPDQTPPQTEREKRIGEGYYEPAWTNSELGLLLTTRPPQLTKPCPRRQLRRFGVVPSTTSLSFPEHQ